MTTPEYWEKYQGPKGSWSEFKQMIQLGIKSSIIRDKWGMNWPTFYKWRNRALVELKELGYETKV